MSEHKKKKVFLGDVICLNLSENGFKQQWSSVLNVLKNTSPEKNCHILKVVFSRISV